MSVLFVAGSGTDVGKTHVATGLVRALVQAGRPVRALKPVVSGAPAWDHPDFAQSDTARLLRARGLALTAANVAACSPWRFAAPLGPDLAARAEHRSLRLDELVAWTDAQVAAAPDELHLIIEGVGGVMSPMCDDAVGLDWMAAVGGEVLLVGGSYLGAIGHTLAALACLRARGLVVRGVVVNESPPPSVDLSDTAASLARFAACDVDTLTRGEARPLRPGLAFHLGPGSGERRSRL